MKGREGSLDDVCSPPPPAGCERSLNAIQTTVGTMAGEQVQGTGGPRGQRGASLWVQVRMSAAQTLVVAVEVEEIDALRGCVREEG